MQLRQRRAILSPPVTARRGLASEARLVASRMALRLQRLHHLLRDRRRALLRAVGPRGLRSAPPPCATRRAARLSACTISWPGRSASLARPANSKSAHGAATFSAHSVVQWSSITFFCAARHRVVLVLVHHPDERRRVERHVHVVASPTLSMPNRLDRAPREGDRVGDAALEHVARLGRRGLHVGAAERR